MAEALSDLYGDDDCDDDGNAAGSADVADAAGVAGAAGSDDSESTDGDLAEKEMSELISTMNFLS
jgi:hypothetical protein